MGKTYKELVQEIMKHGIEDKAKEAVDKAWNYKNIRIEIAEETDWICPDYCIASLAHVKEGYEVIQGKVEIIDKKWETGGCGPDIYSVECIRLRLAPGTVVIHYHSSYPGSTFAIIYVNPPKQQH